MISHDQRHVLELMHPSAQTADRLVGIEQALRGNPSECQDEFGLDEFDLRQQIGSARGDFVGFGIAVARRARFQHIGDVDIVAALAS